MACAGDLFSRSPGRESRPRVARVAERSELFDALWGSRSQSAGDRSKEILGRL